jgi:hypothetical protein
MYVYTKMNHWLLRFDRTNTSCQKQECAFQSALEFVDDMHKSELAAQLGGTPAVQHVDLAASMCDGSGRDDVEDY